MTVKKTIAIFNQSGGVGKSTLAFNLGYEISQRGHEVLLVDMDPQASLSVFMGLEPLDLTSTIYESIIDSQALPIHRKIHGLDLVPSNIDLSGAELELVVADMRDVRLRDALSEVLNIYEYIIIDCPPSLGILSYISLVAASHVLIPIQTEYKALRGTELLLKTLARVRKRANCTLKIAGFIPTMADMRTSQAQSSLESISQLETIGKVFPPIQRTVYFADAEQQHLPLALFAPKHPAVETLRDIATQLTYHD